MGQLYYLFCCLFLFTLLSLNFPAQFLLLPWLFPILSFCFLVNFFFIFCSFSLVFPNILCHISCLSIQDSFFAINLSGSSPLLNVPSFCFCLLTSFISDSAVTPSPLVLCCSKLWAYFSTIFNALVWSSKFSFMVELVTEFPFLGVKCHRCPPYYPTRVRLGVRG